MNKLALPLFCASAVAVALSSCVMPEPMGGGGGYGGGGYSSPPQGYYPQPSKPYYAKPQQGYYPNQSGGYHDHRYDYPSKPGPSNNNGGHSEAYNKGFRVGGDDYRAHRSKHMDRYQKMFTNQTHDAFRDGYDAGYESARRHDH